MIYRMIKQEIERGRTFGLEEKIDLFYKHDRITSEQYNELMTLLKEKESV